VVDFVRDRDCIADIGHRVCWLLHTGTSTARREANAANSGPPSLKFQLVPTRNATSSTAQTVSQNVCPRNVNTATLERRQARSTKATGTDRLLQRPEHLSCGYHSVPDRHAPLANALPKHCPPSR